MTVAMINETMAATPILELDDSGCFTCRPGTEQTLLQFRIEMISQQKNHQHRIFGHSEYKKIFILFPSSFKRLVSIL